jgi:uncharacterized membrane protein (DUF4010 family)
MAALGGLYSSTATTVVLARQAKANPAAAGRAQAGITLATGIMYLRLLAVVAVFNIPLARVLAVPLCLLALAGLVITGVQYRLWEPRKDDEATAGVQLTATSNPLELGAAAIFAILFAAVSVVSALAQSHFGITGIYTLAAFVGVTDIDPFVLNLAQGGLAGVANAALAAAILVAASSNNVLKAFYAISFAGGRVAAECTAALLALAAAGVAAAVIVAKLAA